jgi:AcrR family transcriptional regulator
VSATLPSPRRPADADADRPRSSAPARILRAAEALLVEGGIDGLSIRRLSRRCGYTAPTIYHHFGDKQGLIRALLEECFGDVLERMRSLPHSGDPVRHLREMADVFVGFGLEHPAHYQLLMEPRDRAAVPSLEAAQALVREDLEALRDRGALATDDIDTAFDTLWAVLHGVIALQLGPRSGESTLDLKNLALDVVEAGLLLAKEKTPR